MYGGTALIPQQISIVLNPMFHKPVFRIGQDRNYHTAIYPYPKLLGDPISPDGPISTWLPLSKLAVKSYNLPLLCP